MLVDLLLGRFHGHEAVDHGLSSHLNQSFLSRDLVIDVTGLSGKITQLVSNGSFVIQGRLHIVQEFDRDPIG